VETANRGWAINWLQPLDTLGFNRLLRWNRTPLRVVVLRYYFLIWTISGGVFYPKARFWDYRPLSLCAKASFQAMINPESLSDNSAQPPVLVTVGDAADSNHPQNISGQPSISDIELENQRFREIIDAIPSWVFIKNDRHQYQFVNRAYASFYGIPAHECVGKTAIELGADPECVKGNPEKGIAGFWAADDEVFATGKPVYNSVESMTVNGETKYLQTMKKPFDKRSFAIGQGGWRYVSARQPTGPRCARRGQGRNSVLRSWQGADFCFGEEGYGEKW